MWLVVGLGNPGREYELTRHNIGFMVIDALARRQSAGFSQKFKGDLAQCTLGGEATALLKPLTFMNLSGQSVQPVMAFFKVPLESIIVVHDDLDLEFGQMKIKRGGSSGGHNGLKSIDGCIGLNYLRIRAGIGHPRAKVPEGTPPARGGVISHVLGPFRGRDADDAKVVVDHCADAVIGLISGGLEKTQMTFHGKKLLISPSP
jgi:PTH1 family peptidyl-tRNA hydrolase